MPAGCLASLEAVPTAGWLQIMVLICMQEAGTGFASKPQTDDAEAGDIALDEDETPVVRTEYPRSTLGVRFGESVCVVAEPLVRRDVLVRPGEGDRRSCALRCSVFCHLE